MNPEGNDDDGPSTSSRGECPRSLEIPGGVWAPKRTSDEEEDQPQCYTLEEASSFLSKIQNRIGTHDYQRIAISIRMCAVGLKSMKKPRGGDLSIRSKPLTMNNVSAILLQGAVHCAGKPDLIRIFKEFETSKLYRILLVQNRLLLDCGEGSSATDKHRLSDIDTLEKTALGSDGDNAEKKIEGKQSGGYEGLEFDDEDAFTTESSRAITHSINYLEVDDKDEEHKIRSKEKCRGKSIQDLDLSNCELATPSYRLLPEDYVPSASHRRDQVLNNKLVSATSGSDFRHRGRNQYEESLLKCEDDMFELDMLLQRVSSTVEHGEELLKIMNDIRIEDYFPVINIRCIEHVYGDHGLEVLDLLRNNPFNLLPVVIDRLKQKREEWLNCQASFKGIWSGVYAKNHHKSLDHHITFEQQDLKNFSRKSLVAEITEIKEKKQNKGDEVLILASGGRVPLISHLTYEYADTSIHEDMNEFIKFLCKRQTEKVMMIWENILEGMLGVLIQAHTSEGIGDAEESIQSGANSEAERYKDSDRGVSGSEIADDESPREAPEKDESRIFYGNEKHYVLFRLHQIVYQRLLWAKKTAAAAEMKEGSSSNAKPIYLYRRFMTTLYGLLDGSTTEDDCPTMMGYMLFTLEGLMHELVKQLQIVATDETCDKILHEYESSQGNYVDALYLDNVHSILHDDSVYRFEYLSGRSTLSIQLIDDAYKNDNVAYLNNKLLETKL